MEEFEGLTTQQADIAMKKFGKNEIPDTRASLVKKILKRLNSPISLMLIAASILSLITHKIFDFYFITFLFFFNFIIAIWQEKKADDAIAKLNNQLTCVVNVFRNKTWIKIDSNSLVPNDIIKLSVGNIVTADGKIIKSNNLTINNSTVTGESLPVEKKTNDIINSGAFITTGDAIVQITATGKNTSFGKILLSVERLEKKSLLEKDIAGIAKFLSLMSIGAIAILTPVLYFTGKTSIADIVTLDLSLAIAGIPISLPTVLTLIIELGVVRLASKGAIVRRLSALEDLANVNLLLSDKTGTLTNNKIIVNHVFPYSKFNEEYIIFLATSIAVLDTDNTINKAILEKAKELGIKNNSNVISNYIPFDSNRKRATLFINSKEDSVLISIGAPQIIEKLCLLTKDLKVKLDDNIESLAKRGYRALAVAFLLNSDAEENMNLAGVLALSDSLRDDAGEVINFMKENGITVIMLTGDNHYISGEIIKQLQLNNNVITKQDLDKTDINANRDFIFNNTGAFAEILPSDKLNITHAAKNSFIVAVTGDGINDLPAIKEANVGIAVKNAVDALKSGADIVLLSDGISVIKDAIVESRKIFSRIYSYSIYRISESMRLIITIAILGVWYKEYPLSPIQIILLALLNDIPIISLAYDKVKLFQKPSHVNVKERFAVSSVFGLIGVVNSILLFVILTKFLHADWAIIQTIYFLKLTVSGHLLIYVARTKEKWYKFLPSRQVVAATTFTQLLATILALTGFLMPAKLSLFWIAAVWIWAFVWMQIGEITKQLENRYLTKFLNFVFK